MAHLAEKQRAEPPQATAGGGLSGPSAPAENGHQHDNGRGPNKEKGSHFADAHGGNHGSQVVNHSGPLTFRHLWKPPVVRQWIQGGKLYKEAGSRQPARLELFFDLAYAGIVHQLAENASEAADAIGLAKFILVFYPTWSIWKDVRDYSNISGTDDIKLRLYILVTMILLYGYAANATGIGIEEGGEAIEAEAGEGGEGGYYFAPDAHVGIRSAIGFFLVAKAVRVLMYFYYAFKLSRFRIPLLLSALAMFLSSAIYFPLLFVTKPAAIIAIPSVAIGIDIAAGYVLGIFAKVYLHRRADANADKPGGMCFPAQNFEHLMERNIQIIVVIFGEVIINSIYMATGAEFGVHKEFARSALGITIAFSLIWLFFDQDSSRTFVHAFRRHWITNIAFTQMHFPLSGGIIIFSASLAALIPQAEVSQGLHWYFSGGIACALLSITIIGMLHRSLDQHRSGILARSVRLSLRVLAAAFIAVFPLFAPKSTTLFIGVVAAVLVALVFVETTGKLGSVRTDFLPIEESERRGESAKGTSRIQASKQKHWDRHKNDLSEAEKGEEDVGIETELGDMEVKEVKVAQRLAYTA